ncbi:MAG: hypothetical protein LBG83_05970 [Oscillospiraceae bacterium]|jgi:hypothetical protein|nr:hypothetical protein [Oscillospiraceae bacterium]
MAGQAKEKGKTISAAWIGFAGVLLAAIVSGMFNLVLSKSNQTLKNDLVGQAENASAAYSRGVEDGASQVNATLSQKLEEEYSKGYDDGVNDRELPPPGTDPAATLPTSAPISGDVKPLLDTNPLRSVRWDVNKWDPIDTRDQQLASGITYVILLGDSGGWQSWAEYPVDGKYNQVHFFVAPQRGMRADDRANIKVSVKRENADALEAIYPSTSYKKDVLTASSAKTEKTFDIGNNVEYLRIEIEEIGDLLLWDLTLSNQ